MSDTEKKQLIAASIKNFAVQDLYSAANSFLNALGYKSNKTLKLIPNNFNTLSQLLKAEQKNFNSANAFIDEWKSVDILFQLAEDDISQSVSLFNSNNIDQNNFTSYIFFAVELSQNEYTRGKLVKITRELNKLTAMPSMVIFKYGNFLTFSIIERRLNKRDESKDVLEKVTLIKDIKIPPPSPFQGEGRSEVTHRAHIEILFDLSLEQLSSKHHFTDFNGLHTAWRKTLDTKELNKKFFSELANWYFWAVDKTVWPDDVEKKKEVRNATNVIRLITRLIFVWFLKEKNLVSDKLFMKEEVEKLLKFSDPNKSSYYKAILQNLFFATLNTEMRERKFRSQNDSGRGGNFFVHNLLRYKNEFVNPEETLKTFFDPIPFLNGGLFECLDKEIEINNELVRTRVDGFSDHKNNTIKVPDELFFLEKEKEVNLNDIYGTKNKHYKVRGLLEILNSYKFTITENTPLEEEIALDPELLGKVFENLLASYNPATQTTARKQTGSFYTPREIVNYMVDESITAYLKTKLLSGLSSYLEYTSQQADMFGNNVRNGQLLIEEEINPNRWSLKEDDLELELRKLISYTEEQHSFTTQESDLLIEAIDTCKILDPACGSGAFPMGVLHKLVHLLHKLDPENKKWKELQQKKAAAESEEVFKVDENIERQLLLSEINETFDTNINFPDYGRKIYLIENCLFGVDILPIAVQIAKLRFFISLLIEQKVDWSKPDKNYNIKPLPNLETKIVAANTLIGIEKPEGLEFRNKQVEAKEKELSVVRQKHFNAKTYKTKSALRSKDTQLRKQISEIIKKEYALFCAGINDDIKREQSKLIAGKKTLHNLEKSDKSEAYIKELKEKYLKEMKSVEKRIVKLTTQIENNSGIESAADKIANWNPYNHNSSADFFDPEWMFGLIKGFDIVIGNPPYVVDKNLSNEVKKYFETTYESALYQINLYLLFIEKSLKVSNDFGITSFIIPNTWLINKTVGGFRKYLVENYVIKSISDLTKINVFDATVLPVIFIASREKPQKPYYIKVDEFYGEKFHFKLAVSTRDVLNDRNFIINYQLHSAKQETLKKIELGSKSLNEYSFVSFGVKFYQVNKGIPKQTRKIVDSHAFTHERRVNKSCKRILEGKDIDRYSISYGGKWIEYGAWLAEPRKPELFEGERILLRRIVGKEYLISSIVTGDYCNNSLLHTIKIFDHEITTKYLLGLLNSRLMGRYFIMKYARDEKTFPEIRIHELESLPIKKSEQQVKISVIIDYILELKKTQNDSLFFEQVINSIVYELYFPEEIKVAGCEILKHLADFPELKEDWTDEKKLKAIEKVYKELSSPTHPVSIAMFKMDTVEEVRIIEGKN